ncbi:Histone-lysine N-methyltransferase, H3 lysine-9 specific SUVH4 [Morella rubra]|uniref:Histone-lysine N-methyltransferase, H3 lysine-9 specific SUVH4 n=1 Tax=Morella rubra TaxID=262757 RepID=A0A6A1ULR6_9ROSI|nr:Histone-lysine N-methyltransferase, H3 lysine-9 specific SUVH4 [Morella rubra]
MVLQSPKCTGTDEADATRRVSARIKDKQKAEKELLVRRRVELLDDHQDVGRAGGGGVGGSGKRIKHCYKRRRTDENVYQEKANVAVAKTDEGFELAAEQMNPSLETNDRVGSETAAATTFEKSDNAKVKETLRLFNKYYLHFVQEEEKRCAKIEVEKKASKASKSKKNAAPEDTKTKAKRPDLKAVSKMMETNEILYPEKRFGDIPGIKVGHQFYARAEMVAVGFHSHWLNGIDYMGQSYQKGEYRNYTFPVAVAIVLSGMYEDDLDNAEDVVYTGQGGHNLTGNKRQIQDQKMERGNLALKNCVEQGVPVRVVRGHESRSSYTGKVYTYDGLYKVVQYWAEKGISGFTVYKYRLRRLEGQPILTTNQRKNGVHAWILSLQLVQGQGAWCGQSIQVLGKNFCSRVGVVDVMVDSCEVHFSYGRVPQSISEIRGLVCEDITGGQEGLPIPATNLVDDPPVAPTGKLNYHLCSMPCLLHMKLSGFKYCKSIQVAPNVKLPTNATGCNCKGICVDPRTCACAMLNGSDFPYVSRDGGRLIEAKDVVFECGPKCGCGPIVFRTAKKGWAVRSWDFIPSGAPICEYIGILTRTQDLDNASENNYIFDIDCLQTMKGLGGRERRLRDVSVPTTSSLENLKCESVPEFCIDAGSTGNVARFINHSCEPNLFVQCVLSSHHDIKLARVMLFAADNIPPLQELTYDYGYALDSVYGPDGNIKQMPCFCGATDCRRRLF